MKRVDWGLQSTTSCTLGLLVKGRVVVGTCPSEHIKLNSDHIKERSVIPQSWWSRKGTKSWNSTRIPIYWAFFNTHCFIPFLVFLCHLFLVHLFFQFLSLKQLRSLFIVFIISVDKSTLSSKETPEASRCLMKMSDLLFTWSIHSHRFSQQAYMELLSKDYPKIVTRRLHWTTQREERNVWGIIVQILQGYWIQKDTRFLSRLLKKSLLWIMLVWICDFF